MKNFVCTVAVFSICCAVSALPMDYEGISLEVETVVGTGTNQTMIVIDWETGFTQSHAWLYTYDGMKVVADALDAIQSEVPDFQWSGTAFADYINYDDGLEYHHTVNTGWISFWNKDSGDWALNNLGVYEQQLMNGGWSGSIADDYPDWGDVPPTIPSIPEPNNILIFVSGIYFTLRRRK